MRFGTLALESGMAARSRRGREDNDTQYRSGDYPAKSALNPLRKFDSLLPVFRRRSILEGTTKQLATYSLLPK